MFIFEKNGWINIHSPDIDLSNFEWLTKINDEDYKFILNSYTKEKFKNDFIIYRNNISFNDNTFKLIKEFKANELLTNSHIPKDPDPSRPLMQHQIYAVNLMLTHNKYAFFYGTGTGKTFIVLSYLLTEDNLSAIIITTAKVVPQYKEQVNKYLGTKRNIIVTNYEQLNKHFNEFYDVLILDESHKAKSFSSQINKDCCTMRNNCTKCFIFTGTPQDRNRHEIIAQLKILDKRIVPSKTGFINRYFKLNDYYQPKSEIKYMSNELSKIIEDYSYGIDTEKAIDTTEIVEKIFYCEKPDKYDELLDNRIITIDNDFSCVADNKAILRLKLRELCSGHLVLTNIDQSETKTILTKTNKPIILKQILAQVNTGIIGYIFNYDMFYIESVLNELNYKYKIINGSTNKKDINEYQELFKNNKIEFLIIQCKSGAEGLDFPYKDTIIFYDLPESYIQFHQFKSRIRRIGQKNKCNYYYLLCKDTVEEQVYKALKKKKNFTNEVFKIYHKEK